MYIYCNAGHNTPYILRDRVIPLTGARNSLLGVFPGEEFTEDSVRLEPGDALFLYTDGVTEATNAEKMLYGNDRLLDCLEKGLDKSVSEHMNMLKEDIDKFVGKAEQFDDITIMAMRIH